MSKNIYIGFLRGINVGGHHKVPMAELREQLAAMGYENIRTLLNTGNIVFETGEIDLVNLQEKIEEHISKHFGFPIPLILRTKSEIDNLADSNPFADIDDHKDIRLYVSFLKDEPKVDIELPYFSVDKGFQIVSADNRMICSVIDLSTTKTPKGMAELEKLFGKDVTTRNWNTIQKVAAA